MPTIALVDDDRNILTSLRMVLEAEGYKTQTYNDGASALDGFAESPPDLAILDIKMFPIDGVALLTEIKRHSPSTQVVMITAYPTADSRNECLKIGASTYLTKPLDIQELKTVVQNLAVA